MDILFHSQIDDQSAWLAALRAALPEARVRAWQVGDVAQADYALVWKPPAEVLQGRVGLKAVFNLGAGVDAVLAFLERHPGLLPPTVKLIRLEDAGMALQMTHFVVHAVLHHFRRMDAYAESQRQARWAPLAPRAMSSYPVGVLGAGVLGGAVAQALVGLGFAVRSWSRNPKALAGVSSFAGAPALAQFADGLQVLVNLLPRTPETEGILDDALFERLAPGACLVNVARGAHLVEADLIAALERGRLERAVLDVFRDEPLPADHPFWRHPRITVTPHVSAATLLDDSVAQIASKIRALEQGQPVSGVVNVGRGY